MFGMKSVVLLFSQLLAVYFNKTGAVRCQRFAACYCPSIKDMLCSGYSTLDIGMLEEATVLHWLEYLDGRGRDFSTYFIGDLMRACPNLKIARFEDCPCEAVCPWIPKARFVIKHNCNCNLPIEDESTTITSTVVDSTSTGTTEPVSSSAATNPTPAIPTTKRIRVPVLHLTTEAVEPDNTTVLDNTTLVTLTTQLDEGVTTVADITEETTTEEVWPETTTQGWTSEIPTMSIAGGTTADTGEPVTAPLVTLPEPLTTSPAPQTASLDPITEFPIVTGSFGQDVDIEGAPGSTTYTYNSTELGEIHGDNFYYEYVLLGLLCLAGFIIMCLILYLTRRKCCQTPCPRRVRRLIRRSPRLREQRINQFYEDMNMGIYPPGFLLDDERDNMDSSEEIILYPQNLAAAFSNNSGMKRRSKKKSGKHQDNGESLTLHHHPQVNLVPNPDVRQKTVKLSPAAALQATRKRPVEDWSMKNRQFHLDLENDRMRGIIAQRVPPAGKVPDILQGSDSTIIDVLPTTDHLSDSSLDIFSCTAARIQRYAEEPYPLDLVPGPPRCLSSSSSSLQGATGVIAVPYGSYNCRTGWVSGSPSPPTLQGACGRGEFYHDDSGSQELWSDSSTPRATPYSSGYFDLSDLKGDVTEESLDWPTPPGYLFKTTRV